MEMTVKVPIEIFEHQCRLIGFKEDVVPIKYWDEVKIFNHVLFRLNWRKKEKLHIDSNITPSTAVWRLLTFYQAVIYRSVQLGKGCAIMWEENNLIGSSLCSRAIIETGSFLYDFKVRLTNLCENDDSAAIERLIENRVFGTRTRDLIKESPNCRAVNILDCIDSLAKKFPSVRSDYELLSEFCHPNADGHFMTFSELLDDNGNVQFSDKFGTRRFSLIFGGYMMLAIIESSINDLRKLANKVAELTPTLSKNLEL